MEKTGRRKSLTTFITCILFVLLSFLYMIKGRRGRDRMVLDLQLPR
jgi:hypothetical protein